MAKQKTLRKAKPAVIEALRLLVIDAIFKKQMKQKAAAELFNVGYSTVKEWCRIYRSEGRKGLLLKKRGRVKGAKELTKVQERWIKKQIVDHLPSQLKLPFALWTREAVRDLITREFKITKSVVQIGRYLKEWGYSPQKPIYKAYEQNPAIVKKWLDEEYPAIKKAAAAEGAEIYWEDEMGMRSDHQAGTTFAPKGKTPVIKKTGKRFRLNMISAISSKGRKQFMIFKDSFNSQKLIVFLEQLIKSTKKKIYLIMDGHPAHKTKIVEKWIEENKERIVKYTLPPYSPELNPQEYMNNDIKINAAGKHRTLNVDQFQAHIESYIHTRNKKIVSNYFHHPKLEYVTKR